LLYHPQCPFRDEVNNEGFHHALIAIYRNVITDKVMAISRRPLMRDGRSLSKPISLGPARGCAIKLNADEEVNYGLHLAEDDLRDLDVTPHITQNTTNRSYRRMAHNAAPREHGEPFWRTDELWRTKFAMFAANRTPSFRAAAIRR
jgi:hypothetical protein